MSIEIKHQNQTYLPVFYYNDRFPFVYKPNYRHYNFVNYIYIITTSNSQSGLSWLDEITDPILITKIMEKYKEFLNFINPIQINLNIEIQQSQNIKTKLFPHQNADLKNILNLENSIDSHNQHNFKIYYNQKQSGKSFVFMELSSNKLNNIDTTNIKYIDTTIIVSPEKTIFDWKDKLQFYYNHPFKVINNKSSYKKFIEKQIDDIDYKIIVVSDSYYNKLIDYFNTELIYFSRLVFDSLFSLSFINTKSKTNYISYLVTNNILNTYVPTNNLLLNNKSIYHNSVLHNILEKVIFEIIKQLNNININIKSLQILKLHYSNNQYNNQYCMKIRSSITYIKETFDNLFNLSMTHTRIDLFNNKINYFKQKYDELLTRLKEFYIPYSQVSPNYYTNSNSYVLEPSCNLCVNTKVNELIDQEKYVDIISIFKMKIEPLNDIVKHFVPETNEVQFDNVKSRINTKECLICYSKPDIEVVSECCNQLFCMSCYMQCFKHNMKCPLCRQTIELSKNFINSDTFQNHNQLDFHLNDLNNILEYSSFYTRQINFENIIKHIVLTDDIPKILINFTDYDYNFMKDKTSSNVGRFKKSLEFKNITKVLQEQGLTHFSSIGNGKQFEKSYKLFSNPLNDIINVFINHNDYKSTSNINFNRSGLGFNSVKYIINYNLNITELQKMHSKKLSNNIIVNSVIEDCNFEQFNHPNFNHDLKIFTLKGY